MEMVNYQTVIRSSPVDGDGTNIRHLVRKMISV